MEIIVSEDTFNRLKKFAEPFVDTPEDALRKVLGVAEELKNRKSANNIDKQHTRLSSRDVTPQKAFLKAITKCLYQMKGEGKIEDVYKALQNEMKGVLKPADFQGVQSSGEIRWQNTARFARMQLVKDGLMEPSSKRGIWKLTRKGLDEYRK